MSKRYMNVAFTPAVKANQEANGSRAGYAEMTDPKSGPDYLGEPEAAFIAARDSFYMATVNEEGWPYVQHRGGPRGFVKLLSPSVIGIADFRGNRQYVSMGNLDTNNRTSLFFMDYVNKRRFKVFARTERVDLSDHPDLAAALVDDGYKAKVERGLLFHIEAFDWNCPQHITQRFTRAEIEPAVMELKTQIAHLEAELARMKSV